MFKRLDAVESNLYKASFPIDLAVAKYYLEQCCREINESKEELQISHLGLSLTVSPTGLMVKTPEHVAVEAIDFTDELVEFLTTHQNLVEYILYKYPDLSNFEFFKYLPEQNLSFDFLNPYMSQLKKSGLDLDTSLVEKLGPGSYFAIDCVDYVKFIPFDQYNKEKQVDQLVDELSTHTSHEPIVEWLENIYRRYLLKNSFDSNGIHHVLDWMNQLTDFTILQKSLSYDRALAKADQWVELTNQKLGISSTRDKEGVDVSTLFVSGGYELKRLLSEDSKKREGQKMHNCIGNIHLKNPDLYSVRFNGRRVSSICFRDLKIVEAKGPWNKAVESNHRKGVQVCLEQGLKVNYLDSNDLGNIGIKVITVHISGQPAINLIAREGDNLYNSQKVISIDDVFNGIETSEIPKVKADLLSKFNLESKEVVELALKESLNMYQACPLMEILFKTNSNYILKTVPVLESVMKTYPQFMNTLKQKVAESRKTDNKTYYLKNLLAGVNALALDLTLLPGEDRTKRAFLSEFLKVNSGELIPGLFQGILFTSKTESIQELYNYVADYTPWKVLVKNLDEITLLEKSEPPNFSWDDFKPKEPDMCKECDNYKIYQDQESLAEEWSQFGNEAEELEEKAEDKLSDIKNFVSDAQKLSDRFHQFLLKRPEFNLISGELDPHTLTAAKELRIDLSEFIEEFEELLKTYKTLSEDVAELTDLNDKLLEIEKEMQRINPKLERLYSETCLKCRKCQGSGEDVEGEPCEDCGGQPLECNGPEVVDENSKMWPSANYTFKMFSPWSKKLVDLQVAEQIYESIQDMVSDPQSLYRFVFEFYKEHEREK